MPRLSTYVRQQQAAGVASGAGGVPAVRPAGPRQGGAAQQVRPAPTACWRRRGQARSRLGHSPGRVQAVIMLGLLQEPKPGGAQLSAAFGAAAAKLKADYEKRCGLGARAPGRAGGPCSLADHAPTRVAGAERAPRVTSRTTTRPPLLPPLQAEGPRAADVPVAGRAAAAREAAAQPLCSGEGAARMECQLRCFCSGAGLPCRVCGSRPRQACTGYAGASCHADSISFAPQANRQKWAELVRHCRTHGGDRSYDKNGRDDALAGGQAALREGRTRGALCVQAVAAACIAASFVAAAQQRMWVLPCLPACYNHETHPPCLPPPAILPHAGYSLRYGINVPHSEHAAYMALIGLQPEVDESGWAALVARVFCYVFRVAAAGCSTRTWEFCGAPWLVCGRVGWWVGEWGWSWGGAAAGRMRRELRRVGQGRGADSTHDAQQPPPGAGSGSASPFHRPASARVFLLVSDACEMCRRILCCL